VPALRMKREELVWPGRSAIVLEVGFSLSLLWSFFACGLLVCAVGARVSRSFELDEIFVPVGDVLVAC
jgi:hypothetical protein